MKVENPFKKKVDVNAEVRTATRTNNSAARDVEREIAKLDVAEKRLLIEIKREAKKSPANAKISAKQLVQLRAQRTNLQKSVATIKGQNTMLVTSKANMAVAETMGKTAVAMGAANAAMDPARMAADMQAFAKANAQMEMSADMMGDALDDLYDDAGAEGEADDLVNQVLEEAGIDAVTGMVAAPTRRVRVAPAAASQEDAEVERLMASLR